jgi:hypothetical protein
MNNLEDTPPTPPPLPGAPSAKKFWIIFLLPTLYTAVELSLAGLGFTFSGLGDISALLQTALSIFSGAWCANWLTRRFMQRHVSDSTGGVVLAFLLIGMNLIISFVGCAAHFQLNLH